MRLNRIHVGLAAVCLVGAGLATVPSAVWATPYASNVNKTGTTINFILNEPADTLTYKINGGAPQVLDGTTKGAKTFNLTAPTDTFSISAEKNSPLGFLIPLGTEIAPQTNGPSVATKAAGFNLLSDDANKFTRYNSPRGIDVNRNPNTPNFGTVYISNSTSGAVTTGVAPDIITLRTLTSEGLYALRADQSDAFGFGDAGQNPNNTTDGFPAFNTNTSAPSGTNSPYRITVAPNGELFISDYSDINGWAFVMPPNLSSITNLLKDFGGPAPVGVTADGTGLPAGQNHGSISAIYVEGSLATNNLVMYAMDEDLNSAHVSGVNTDPQNNRNSLWRWDIGGTTNSTVTPVLITPGVVSLGAAPIVPAPNGLIGDFPAGGIVVDMVRGPGGNFYLAQNRTDGNQPGLIATDSAGAIIFNSLEVSRTLLNNPTNVDIFRGVGGIDVSPDGKWLAIVQINNDLSLIPILPNGVPDIANRLLVDGGANTGNGRDIAFDAAGNLHYVTSGLALYRTIAPGGHTLTTLDFNGTSYAFSSVTIPTTPTNDADFNDDTKVDALDLALWAGTFGGAATATTGDANGDNLATGEDFLLWQQQYKNAAAAATVPEPANWCSAAVAALILATVAAPRRRAALQRAAR